MGKPEIEDFLSHLATELNVASLSRSHALRGNTGEDALRQFFSSLRGKLNSKGF